MAMELLADHLKDYPQMPAELPAAQQEVREGLLLMAGAIQARSCLIAVHEGEVVAALGFEVLPDHVSAGDLGSRQIVYGASWAVELALVEEAARRRLPVRGTYWRPKRAYHLGLCRRLDLRPQPQSSDWTADDCRAILEGMRARP